MANNTLETEISVEVLQENLPLRRNMYGSVIAESEEQAAEHQDEGQEGNRSYCLCKSACKTKRKDGSSRGCLCRTANLPCVATKCKCGTSRKPCANMNLQTVSRLNLPVSSMERQRRDIENARQEIEEFVDELEGKQRRRLLVVLINNSRGSLDFAARLLAIDEDEDPQPEPLHDGARRRCICNNCIQMPTPDQNKRCRRRECITSYELFANLRIDRHVLELVIRARSDIRVEPLDFSLSSFRKAVLWKHVRIMGIRLSR